MRRTTTKTMTLNCFKKMKQTKFPFRNTFSLGFCSSVRLLCSGSTHTHTNQTASEISIQYRKRGKKGKRWIVLIMYTSQAFGSLCAAPLRRSPSHCARVRRIETMVKRSHWSIPIADIGRYLDMYSLLRAWLYWAAKRKGPTTFSWSLPTPPPRPSFDSPLPFTSIDLLLDDQCIFRWVAQLSLLLLL